jgi:hypothetical protein
MNAYTVWVAHGRIGTYRTREKAEQVQSEVIANIEQLARIQEWTPQEYERPFVTFNDEDELISD